MADRKVAASITAAGGRAVAIAADMVVWEQAGAAQCLIETAEQVNLWNLDLISCEQTIDPI